MTGSVYSKDDAALTPDFLVSGKWVLEEGFDDCRCTIEFTAKGRFTINRKDCVMQDRSNINASGIYKISGDSISFTVDKENEPNTEFTKGFSFTALLAKSDSLKYRWLLDFTTSDIGKLNNYNSLIKEGESVSIKGIDSVSTGEKKGTVTAPLKMREAPDTTAKESEYGGKCVQRADKKGSDYVPFKSYEKGTELKIFARTKNMSKVGKLNNYWYYVKYADQDCDDGQITERAGWVFGEYVKMK